MVESNPKSISLNPPYNLSLIMCLSSKPVTTIASSPESVDAMIVFREPPFSIKLPVSNWSALSSDGTMVATLDGSDFIGRFFYILITWY